MRAKGEGQRYGVGVGRGRGEVQRKKEGGGGSYVVGGQTDGGWERVSDKGAVEIELRPLAVRVSTLHTHRLAESTELAACGPGRSRAQA